MICFFFRSFAMFLVLCVCVSAFCGFDFEHDSFVFSHRAPIHMLARLCVCAKGNI